MGDVRGGGGTLPSSGTAGRLLPVGVTKAPALSVEGPRSVPSRISVVLVDGPPWPRENRIWRPRAGETKPTGVSVGGGDDGLPRVGETLSSRKVPSGGARWGVLLSGYCELCGLRWPGCYRWPIGPCETLSPLFHDALGPLEHSVPAETILGLDPLEHSGLDHAGPVGRHVAGGHVGPDETLLGLDPLEHSGLDQAGQHTAVGPVGLFGMLSPSDCYPAGPYVAGAPVGPDEKFQVLDQLEHSGSDYADPAGQYAAVGPVGLFGTLSPSDCYPAGPAGPYVAGGPVGPDEKF